MFKEVLAAESAVDHAVEAVLHVPVPFLSRTVCSLAEAATLQEVHLQYLFEMSSEEQKSRDLSWLNFDRIPGCVCAQ